jgi:hypothetical protein
MHFPITNCEEFKIAIAAWNVFFSKMLKKNDHEFSFCKCNVKQLR